MQLPCTFCLLLTKKNLLYLGKAGTNVEKVSRAWSRSESRQVASCLQWIPITGPPRSYPRRQEECADGVIEPLLTMAGNHDVAEKYQRQSNSIFKRSGKVKICGTDWQRLVFMTSSHQLLAEFESGLLSFGQLCEHLENRLHWFTKHTSCQMTLISCFERVNRLQTYCIVTAARCVLSSSLYAGRAGGMGRDSSVASRHWATISSLPTLLKDDQQWSQDSKGSSWFSC